MTDFTDDELIAFVLGRPAERAADIRRRAEEDTEFAAELAVMRAVCGVSAVPIVVPGRPRWPAGPRKVLRRLTAAAVALCMLGSVSWGAWYMLHTPPLLQDNFNDRWVNLELWQTPRPIVREEGGHLALVNRGYLLTDKEFPGPIDLRLRWRWRDLAGWPQYSDSLTVVLRTAGRPLDVHPYLTGDGIAIDFKAADGTVSISGPLVRGVRPVLAHTPPAAAPLPAGEWHSIRVTDDGDTIAVYLYGPAVPPREKDAPLLTVRCPDDAAAHRIALYNRERVADVPHESHIDDVIVRRLAP